MDTGYEPTGLFTITQKPVVGCYSWENGQLKFNLQNKPSLWHRLWMKVIFGCVWIDSP